MAEALVATSEVINNRAYQDLILATVKEVKDGHPLTVVFEHSNLFPGTVTQMLSVGEQTGRLDDILGKLTNFYTLELETRVRTLIALFEPLILVIMGVGVGIMVSAIILPMYQLATSF